MIVPYISNIESGREFKSLFFQVAIESKMSPAQREDIYGYWAANDILQSSTLHISSFLNDALYKEQGITSSQATILSYANKFFGDSRSLSEFEGEVLAKTLNRLAKRSPTRANRK